MPLPLNTPRCNCEMVIFEYVNDVINNDRASYNGLHRIIAAYSMMYRLRICTRFASKHILNGRTNFYSTLQRIGEWGDFCWLSQGLAWELQTIVKPLKEIKNNHSLIEIMSDDDQMRDSNNVPRKNKFVIVIHMTVVVVARISEPNWIIFDLE